MAGIVIKKAPEVEAMRHSCHVASSILERISNAAEPGVTTGELDAMAADLIREAGGKSPFYGYRGFPGHICVSVNEEVVHGIGGKRKLQFGDLVKLDVGIILEGWIGDTAASVPVGEASPEARRLMDWTEGALLKGVEAARSGNRLGDVSAAIEKHVQAGGYSVVREFVGHGVGRKLHEEPQIPNYGKPGTGPKLAPGMTLAIEPMVNVGAASIRILEDNWTVVTSDGKLSSHFEHTVLVTENEPEILTCRNLAISK